MQLSKSFISSQLNESQIYKILQIWLMQNEILNRFMKIQIQGKIICLVGKTNVGKTTCLYYLNGLELRLQQDVKTKIKQMKAIQEYEGAIISNSLSTTEVPNIFISNQQSPQKFTLIDMPGMNDTKFINLLSNIFTFQHVFHKLETVKKIHIILVIQQLDDVQDLKQILKQYTLHFNTNILQPSQPKFISILFTKTEYDLQQTIQRFSQFIQAIKQQLQQQEGQQQFLQFINYLYQNKDAQKFIFLFPKQDPDTQKGKQIVQDILQRNQFLQKTNQTLILHRNFTQNILDANRIHFTNFDNNFAFLFNQILSISQKSIAFLIPLTKILHKKWIDNLFETQQIFDQNLSIFCENQLPFVNMFKKNRFIKQNPLLEENQLKNILITVAQNLQSQQNIGQLDKHFSLFFQLSPDPTNQSTQISLKKPLLIQSIRGLLDIYRNFQYIFSTTLIPQQLQKINDFCQNICNFMNWYVDIWYESLVKINQIDKIKDRMLKTEEQFKTQKLKASEELKTKDIILVEKIIEYGAKIYDDNDQSDDYDEVKTIIKKEIVLDTSKLQYYSMIPQKKNIDKQIQQIISQNKIALLQSKQKSSTSQQQSKSLKEIKVLAMYQIIQKALSLYQELVASSSLVSINDQVLTSQNIKKILKRILYLRQDKFIQLVLNNFMKFQKFIFYCTMNNTNEYYRTVSIKFMQNLIKTIEKYFLFEEILILALLVYSWEDVHKYLIKGLTFLKLSDNFLHQLIVLIRQINNNRANGSYLCKNTQLDTIKEIVERIYNYLIMNSPSRTKQKQYQKEYQQIYNQLNKDIKLEEQNKAKSYQFQLNILILEHSLFVPLQIAKKIEILHQRNQIQKDRIRAYKTLLDKYLAVKT